MHFISTFTLGVSLENLSRRLFIMDFSPPVSRLLEYFSAGVGFHQYVAGVFGFSFAIIVVPVTLAGVVLPWIWHAASAQSGAAVGGLAAVNTLAAAAGSAVASFVLLPLAGLPRRDFLSLHPTPRHSRAFLPRHHKRPASLGNIAIAFR